MAEEYKKGFSVSFPVSLYDWLRGEARRRDVSMNSLLAEFTAKVKADSEAPVNG
jgi:hypothetical protein